MNKENTEKLFNDFPLLYINKDKGKMETSMCWGFSCNDGWFDIVYDLSQKIEKEIQKMVIYKHINIPKAIQVKEKFGGLRFYISSGNDLIFSYIKEAENICCKTCETCGKPGKLNSEGWWKTLCNDHIKERNEQKNGI